MRNIPVLLALLLAVVTLCNGHAYIYKPASRNNMRIVVDAKGPTECPYTTAEGGCTVPDNDYDKQSGAAGGPGVVHAKCNFGDTSCVPQHGMCGDKFDGDQNHVEGGKFSSGLVNGIFKPGQTIYLDMLVTAHHKGYHEFTLYDVADTSKATTVTTPATTSYSLKRHNPDLTHTKCEYWTIDPSTQWCMPPPTGSPINTDGYKYTVAVELPKDVACKRCVLQWHWVTGNSPGANPEEFWNCVDVTIRSTGPYINDEARTETPDAGYAAGATEKPSDPSNNPTATPPAGNPNAACVAVAGKGIDNAWCQSVNCDPVYVEGGYCQYSGTATKAPAGSPTTAPETAPSDCVAVAGKGVTDAWCKSVNCDKAYDGYCVKSTSATTTTPAATSAATGTSAPTAAPTAAPTGSTSPTTAPTGTSAPTGTAAPTATSAPTTPANNVKVSDLTGDASRSAVAFVILGALVVLSIML